jgi:hypothetical protein
MLLLILLSCESVPTESARAQVKPEPQVETTLKQQPYSDSLSEQLIKEQLAANEEIKIDTFRALHTFQDEAFTVAPFTKVDTSMLNKYAAINQPLTKNQHTLLNVTDHLSNLTYSDQFNAYLFYNKSMESHYGNSIELITITKHTNDIDRLTLTQEYFSEGYEYMISSEFISREKILVSKVEKTRQGKDLRIRETKEAFVITSTGNINKIDN